ncbi:putative uncharacterized protein C3orf49 [Stegostoma tigrinum]|uniref:putative uncharacterized protein C3orf49 n=1 Tax=Stegostoma tigrinum TaxID=3053191 RepID=UPI00202B1B27|nr:putative uncharacterized protein C3orf49 [Stegostoma tigrinum]
MRKNHASCVHSQAMHNQDPNYQRLMKREREALENKGKGIVRWHSAVSTKLAKPILYIPEDEMSRESSSECNESKKKSLMNKMRKTVGRFIAHHYQSKQLKIVDKRIERDCARSPLRTRSFPHFPVKCHHILRTSKMPDSPLEFLEKPTSSHVQCNDSHSYRSRGTKGKVKQLANIDETKIFSTLESQPQKTATIHVDVDVLEAETASIFGNNLVVTSRRMSRRVSVTSLPTDKQKAPRSRKKQYLKIFKKKNKRKNVEQSRRHSFLTVGKLQAQVDDLIETVSEKSMKLLAQRHAELQQCEYLGDEILQSSKMFQRVSKKSARKYKWKKCFLCGCCC